MSTPVKYIKVGFKGVKIIKAYFVMKSDDKLCCNKVCMVLTFVNIDWKAVSDYCYY